jgi:hypothetical protein
MSRNDFSSLEYHVLHFISICDLFTDSPSHIILSGRWCDITVLNVHAPAEDKIDDMKDSFYDELECVLDIFPKYHMKLLTGDWKPKKVGKTL